MQADELIKKEMLDMIRYDRGLPTNEFYESFDDEELAAAKVRRAFECVFISAYGALELFPDPFRKR